MQIYRKSTTQTNYFSRNLSRAMSAFCLCIYDMGNGILYVIGLLMLLLCLSMPAYLLFILVLIILFLDLYVLSTLNSMQHYHHTFRISHSAKISIPHDSAKHFGITSLVNSGNFRCHKSAGNKNMLFSLHSQAL